MPCDTSVVSHTWSGSIGCAREQTSKAHSRHVEIRVRCSSSWRGGGCAENAPALSRRAHSRALSLRVCGNSPSTTCNSCKEIVRPTLQAALGRLSWMLPERSSTNHPQHTICSPRRAFLVACCKSERGPRYLAPKSRVLWVGRWVGVCAYLVKTWPARAALELGRGRVRREIAHGAIERAPSFGAVLDSVREPA